METTSQTRQNTNINECPAIANLKQTLSAFNHTNELVNQSRTKRYFSKRLNSDLDTLNLPEFVSSSSRLNLRSTEKQNAKNVANTNPQP
jgi:hypothetical protein